MSILSFLIEALLTAVAYVGVGILGLLALVVVVMITWIQATE